MQNKITILEGNGSTVKLKIPNMVFDIYKFCTKMYRNRKQLNWSESIWKESCYVLISDGEEIFRKG